MTRLPGAFLRPFFEQKITVVQLRTQLGLPEQERSGLESAAKVLLELLEKH
jgi:hypothetical protein